MTETDHTPLAACPPTHTCVVCAAKWIKHDDGTWSVLTDCGPCCDNASMDKAPIAEILRDENGSAYLGEEADKIRRAYQAKERAAVVDRYRGIECALCEKPFEQHASDWTCPHRVAPRFKFPLERQRTQLEATPASEGEVERVEGVALADELERLDKAATPGPWEMDSEYDRDAEYGSGPDPDSGYNNYNIAAQIDGKWQTLIDTLNSEHKEISAEYDGYAWDAIGRANVELIVALRNNLTAILTALRARTREAPTTDQGAA